MFLNALTSDTYKMSLLSHKLLEKRAMQSAQYMYNKARSQ